MFESSHSFCVECGVEATKAVPPKREQCDFRNDYVVEIENHTGQDKRIHYLRASFVGILIFVLACFCVVLFLGVFVYVGDVFLFVFFFVATFVS